MVIDLTHLPFLCLWYQLLFPGGGVPVLPYHGLSSRLRLHFGLQVVHLVRIWSHMQTTSSSLDQSWISAACPPPPRFIEHRMGSRCLWHVFRYLVKPRKEALNRTQIDAFCRSPMIWCWGRRMLLVREMIGWPNGMGAGRSACRTHLRLCGRVAGCVVIRPISVMGKLLTLFCYETSKGYSHLHP